MVRIRPAERNVLTQTEEPQAKVTKTAETQCDLDLDEDGRKAMVAAVPYMVVSAGAPTEATGEAAAADSQPLKPPAVWDLGAPAQPILEPIQRPCPPRRARVQRWTWVPAEKVDGPHAPMEWRPSVQSTGMPPPPRRP